MKTISAYCGTCNCSHNSGSNRNVECKSSLSSSTSRINQSINQSLFSIQANNNNNIHTFINMNTERAGNEVMINNSDSN